MRDEVRVFFEGTYKVEEGFDVIFIFGGEPDEDDKPTKALHTYTIIDAIRDKNVLQFKVDYIQTMKMKDAGLPKIVLDQTPKYLRGRKMPIVKAKVGPQVMTLLADPRVFEQIPVKAEVKAEVSGIYIVGIKSVRGGKIAVTEKKKKGFWKKVADKANETVEKNNKATAKKNKKK